LCFALVACGGSGGSDAPADEVARIQAATTTAQSSTNACAAVQPFYWEIGNASGALASGSVNQAGNPVTYTATTTMPIASASKWLYGGYVAQRRAGVLTAEDIKYLNFRSGYTHFDSCNPADTVASCVARGTNGVYDPATDNRFNYGGGHMEKHASLMGLDAMNNATLAAEIRSQLGTDIALTYTQPQLAGGVNTSASEYARYLRKLLAGQLQMGHLLGSSPVCTNPLTCTTADATPIPLTESWHYSVGHWVEDDPAVGDGAFSSAGAFGFYPWIDAGHTYYGVLARNQFMPGEGRESVFCGRLIRKAWATGTAQ
jgi:hypothetical protein